MEDAVNKVGSFENALFIHSPIYTACAPCFVRFSRIDTDNNEILLNSELNWLVAPPNIAAGRFVVFVLLVCVSLPAFLLLFFLAAEVLWIGG